MNKSKLPSYQELTDASEVFEVAGEIHQLNEIGSAQYIFITFNDEEVRIFADPKNVIIPRLSLGDSIRVRGPFFLNGNGNKALAARNIEVI